MLRIGPAETPAALASCFAHDCASESSAACEHGCDCCNCGETWMPSTKKVRARPELFADIVCCAEMTCVSVADSLDSGVVRVNDQKSSFCGVGRPPDVV